jgi:hypothetical protein
VPDNVREGEFKFTRRKVPQRIYHLVVLVRLCCDGGAGVSPVRASTKADQNGGARVKRCGKSAPPRQ